MFYKLIYFNLILIVNCVEFSIFPSIPITVTTSKNALCTKHSQHYLNNLKNFTLWAYEMRDASAQSSTSALRGSRYSLGSREQCLTAKSPFPTQYCLSKITANIPNLTKPHDPFTLDFDGNENVLNKLYPYKVETKFARNVMSLGWCIPASCEPKLVEESLNEYLNNVNVSLNEANVTFNAKVLPLMCQRSNNKEGLDGADIAFCVLVGTLLVLAGIGTFMVGNKEKADLPENCSFFRQLSTAFSIQNNYNDLVKDSNSDKPLKILSGVKTFSMSMIVLAHSSAMYNDLPLISMESTEKAYRSLWTIWVVRIDLFVDTFFFISGLLTTYSLLEQINMGKWKPALNIILRYLRLTPLYALVVFYQATLLYHTGDGVFWEAIVGQERNDCRISWWSNLLYISNFVNAKKTCIVQSWYLACEFHFFLVALPLIYVLHKKKFFGFFCIVTCILASTLVTFSLVYVYRKPGLLMFVHSMTSNPKYALDANLIYIKSYTRISPYCIGMIAGYVYHKKKGTNYQLTKIRSILLLSLSLPMIIVLIFSGLPFYNPYHAYNVIESSLFASFNRILWTLSTFCFIYSISFGPVGILYKFLSCHVFVPLSRLSYGGYLWQMAFLLRYVGSASVLIKDYYFDLWLMAFHAIVGTYMLSFASFLLVEQPSKKLLMALLKKSKDTSSQHNGVTLKKTHLKTEDNKV